MDTHLLPQGSVQAHHTKHDLALAYFPNLKAPAAERKFRRWINENPYLINRLKKCGYRTFCKTLTPKQLRIVFSVLGPP